MSVRIQNAIEAGTLPKQLLIEGPAGTGKTYAILYVLHLLAADIPDLRILFCRQTRVSLTESVLVTFEQEILPADGMDSIAHRVSRRGRQSYEYPNGSVIVLGGLDNPARIYSTSWDIIYVNESIEVIDESWDNLWSRLNRPGRPSWLGYLIGDTNPGDPNHWLNKRCDAGEIGRWKTGHEANPVLHDGRDWTDVGKLYRSSLERLKGSRKKRFYDGIWSAGEGQWFTAFDPELHVTKRAEFDPRWPVHLSIDTGQRTAAVLWQPRGDGPEGEVTIFADYFSDIGAPYTKAKAILEMCGQRCGGRYGVGRHDPSGNSDNGYGVIITSEFQRAGLKSSPWIKYPGCEADGLALLESFLGPDPVRLTIHPRCQHLVDAFNNFKRARRGGQWLDEPEPRQHPYEDVMDALRSGVLDHFPDGRKPKFAGIKTTAQRMMY